MTLRQLEMLRAVASGGSLSEAARRLHRSQPAVSMQMKALAAEVGVELFRAGPKGRELTLEGEILATYAERILRLVDEGSAATRHRRRAPAVVRVAASNTPGVNLLPPRLAAFRRKFPHTEARLEVINSEEVERRVLAGHAEVGVVGGRRTLADLSAEPWCEDELVLALPPRHRLARGRRPVAAEALSHETLLLREAGSATRATIEAAFLRARAPLPPIHVVGSTDAIKSAVAAGLGVGILSRFSIEPERRRGDLAARRVAAIDLRRPLLLLFDPARTASEPVANLLEFLRRSRPRAHERRRAEDATRSLK